MVAPRDLFDPNNLQQSLSFFSIVTECRSFSRLPPAQHLFICRWWGAEKSARSPHAVPVSDSPSGSWRPTLPRHFSSHLYTDPRDSRTVCLDFRHSQVSSWAVRCLVTSSRRRDVCYFCRKRDPPPERTSPLHYFYKASAASRLTKTGDVTPPDVSCLSLLVGR